MTIDRVTVNNTCAAGVDVAPTGGGTSNVILQDALIQNSQQGSGPAGDGAALRVGAGGHAFVIRSALFNNTIGLAPLNSGLIDFYSDSQLRRERHRRHADGERRRARSAHPGRRVRRDRRAIRDRPGSRALAGATGPAAFKLVLALVNSSLRAPAARR